MSRTRRAFGSHRLAALAALIAAFLVLVPVLGGTAALAEQVKLNFWLTDWNNDTRKLFIDKNGLIPQWNKAHPDIQVTVNWIGWDTFDDKLITAMAGGVGPDIFQPGAEYVWSIASQGLAIPLDTYFAKWGTLRDFFPATLEAVQYGGKIWGVPYLAAPRALVYRTDVMQLVGLDPTKLPATWEEYAAAAKRMTIVKGNTLVREGADLTINFHKFLAFLWQAGGDILSKDGTKAAFQSEAGVQALQFLVDLKNSIQPASVTDRESNNVPAMVAGRVGVQYDSQHMIMQIANFDETQFENIKVGPPLKKVAQVTPVFTDWLAISSHSKHPQEAWEFIQYLMQPDNLSAYNRTLFFIPPRRSAIQAADWIRKTPGMVDFVNLTDKYGRAVPSFPESGVLRGILDTAISAAVNGEMAPRIALEQAAMQWDGILAKYAKK